ncbi:MAG: multicopper oxidase domain-containing protein [Candidatus Thermoplasmatota archaeon]
MTVTRGRSIVLAVITVAIALVAAGCTGNQAPTPPTTGTTNAIEMKQLLYQPATTSVAVGTTVTWTNHDTVPHTVTPENIALWGTEGSGAAADKWIQPDGTWSFTFTKAGTYTYYCVPHSSMGSDGLHKGMVGTVIVGTGGSTTQTTSQSSAPQAPSNVTTTVVPSAIAPKLMTAGPDGYVHVDLAAKEVTALLADGVSYPFWTFNGTVPGPMIRIKEGDLVMLTLRNDATSLHPHSIDLHAVTGPGGGAAVTQSNPGATTSFTFKAINPGLFVYHCASPHIPDHIANGMYGLILVEPKEGLPIVDKEFYVVQGEAYTSGKLGDKGDLFFSPEKVLAETPDWFFFNGKAAALTGEGALHANVNDTVRIFFGVGGFVPSSFHLIGEVFDRVYLDGNGPPTFNRQTIMVPAAGDAMIEFKVDYPGSYTLVDHTLSRTIDRGAVGSLIVSGWADPTIFNGTTSAGSGH